MNRVLFTDPLSAPHLLIDRLSPSPTRPDALPASHTMSARKRKASEDPETDRMSTSPVASPSFSSRPLASASAHRSVKKSRTLQASARPLSLPRLLETLSADDMRQLLQNVCEQNPELHQEIVKQAPRPSVDASLEVLRKYESDFRAGFPLGNRPSSDYTYNRVRQHLLQLIEALRDYTPQYLPPQESQTVLSLKYLDAATNIIHRIPDWDTFQYQRYKSDAYDEITKAWVLVLREATKRAGGFHVQLGGWDQKLMEHNQKSGGRLDEAVNELGSVFGFSQPGAGAGPSAGTSATPGLSDERASIRQQLFSGTYGQQLGVGPGRW